MNDCNDRYRDDCCEDCVSVEGFRSISQKYQGIENDALETIVQNKSRTIEIKLKSQQYQSKDAFPSQGNSAVVYMDTQKNEAYRWDEQTKSYVCIGADWHQIKIINCDDCSNEQTLNCVIQLRNDTAENWITSNPILLKGEIGIEMDTNKLKVGDGISAWENLKYLNGEISTKDIKEENNLFYTEKRDTENFERNFSKKTIKDLFGGEENLSKQEIIDLIHPINTVMITANDVNPADLIGGVWRETKIIAISELKYWVRVE